jgi:hypothetical protein
MRPPIPDIALTTLEFSGRQKAQLFAVRWNDLLGDTDSPSAL